MAELQAPRGMSDLLPEDEALWRFVRDTAERVAGLFGYSLISTPIVEDVRVFARTSGDESDIVSKEMYVFEDRGGGQARAAPRGHRVRLPRLPGARHGEPPAAGAPLLLRPDVPLRPPAGGPLPPALAVRRRVHRRPLPRRRRRGDRAAAHDLPRVGPRQSRAAHQLDRHGRDAARLHRAPARAPPPAPRQPVPRLAAALRDERAAHPRLEGRRGPPGAARGAEHPRPPLRRGRGALRRRALPARRRRRRLRDRPPHRARPRLLRAHRLGVRAALGGRRGRHAGDRRRRRTLRRPDRAARRPADARHRLRHGHRAHAAQPARARHRGPRRRRWTW